MLEEQVSYFRAVYFVKNEPVYHIALTLATVKDSENMGIGVSIRSPYDKPSKKTGKLIALNRAKYALFCTNNPTRQRQGKFFWVKEANYDIRNFIKTLRSIEKLENEMRMTLYYSCDKDFSCNGSYSCNEEYIKYFSSFLLGEITTGFDLT